MPAGRLWVVATPIGNLEDFTPRARRVLGEVELVAAEDTRHTRKLLSHFGIQAKLLSLHDHNEAKRVPQLVARLQSGQDVALVSDAGTPLISDPGYGLVAAARQAGIRVSAVPGPSALIAALSIAGLPAARFCFEGFLPSKARARVKRLECLAGVRETLVFYETPQRIEACFADLEATLGGARAAVVCKELTKLHESVRADSLHTLARQMRQADSPRGEFVILVAGAEKAGDEDTRLKEGKRLFELLREELAPGKAAGIAARFTGCRRNALYS